MPITADLLAWYDDHAREMPWRIGPEDRKLGVAPDPYRVWLSEIMLQQTTVAAVRNYFLKFTELWPSVSDLAAAHDADVMAEWAGLGYYARARNLLKCARQVVAEHNGRFPTNREALLKLPGIGPYTASAISAIAFDHPETVVDGNVERVISRLFAIETPLPVSKPELNDLAKTLTPSERPGDYAQSVMDLGATICTPKSPACGICPWSEPCKARMQGIAEQLPRKEPKKPKPTRLGIVYLAQRKDGNWLLEQRPDKGLLGGMLGWPGTDWGANWPAEDPPIAANWLTPNVEVRHTFTHFHMRLSLRVAIVPGTAKPGRGEFRPLKPSALPTVMRKAYDLASKQRQNA